VVLIVTALLQEAFARLCEAHARTAIMLPIAGGQRSLRRSLRRSRYESETHGVHLRMAEGRLSRPAPHDIAGRANLRIETRVSFNGVPRGSTREGRRALSQEFGVRSSE
jgi:hypothetical protein